MYACAVAMTSGLGPMVDSGDATPRARARDRDRLIEALFVEHYDALRRLAFVLLADAAQADEVVMDCFAKALSSWGLFRAVEDPRLYLRRMVVNACHSRHRRRAVETRATRTLARARPAQGPDVEVVLSVQGIWARVRRLPERQRACVVLRYLEDLSEAEVARVLDIPLGTVKSQLSRARSKLARDPELELFR